jgi:hypothetical protein
MHRALFIAMLVITVWATVVRCNDHDDKAGRTPPSTTAPTPPQTPKPPPPPPRTNSPVTPPPATPTPPTPSPAPSQPPPVTTSPPPSTPAPTDKRIEITAAPTDPPATVGNLPVPSVSSSSNLADDLVAAFALFGSWDALLNSNSLSLSAALRQDIAGVLDVNETSTRIIDLRLRPNGELSVTFAVAANSGTTGDQLYASFKNAGVSSRWLINTKALYANSGGNADVTVVSTGIASVATRPVDSAATEAQLFIAVVIVSLLALVLL